MSDAEPGSAEAFIRGYMQRGVAAGHHLPSIVIHLAHCNVVPCTCDVDDCEGWALVPAGWTDHRGIGPDIASDQLYVIHEWHEDQGHALRGICASEQIAADTLVLLYPGAHLADPLTGTWESDGYPIATWTIEPAELAREAKGWPT